MRFRGLLLSALLALALFHNDATTAQEVKQIKLTEKLIQNFMAAYEDMAKLYDGADSDKPDPKVEAQAAALAKKTSGLETTQCANPSLNVGCDGRAEISRS
jgi:hypothetical protein